MTPPSPTGSPDPAAELFARTRKPPPPALQAQIKQAAARMNAPQSDPQPFGPHELEGQQIGHYQIKRELGRGGMGVVYLAHDPRLGRDVALKRLSARHDETRRRRFQREARALAKLQHPNVVTILDVGEHNGYPHLVLELVPGDSLQRRLDGVGVLSEREAAELVAKLAHAIAYAHDAGILHRDLKPDNVLLTSEGEPKLTDFGLVHSTLGDETRLSTSGLLQGSLGYLAPEQARGDLTGMCVQTDVYGLGAVLYAALTGFPPIQGESLSGIVAATLSRAPEPPSASCPGLSPQLEAICLRCLAKSPQNRYPSAKELHGALRRYLANDTQPANRSARHWVLGGVAVAIAVTALALLQGVSPAPPPDDVSTREPTKTVRVKSSTPPAPPPEGLAQAKTQAEEEARTLYLRGLQRHRGSDLEGAIADYTSALELDSQFVIAYVMRGAARRTQGDLSGAIVDQDRALEIDPRNAMGYFHRGVARYAGGDLAGALVDYDSALEIDPRHAGACANRGSVHFKQGNLQGALADYNRALEIEPRMVGTYLMRGHVYYEQREMEKAIADYTQCLKIDPQQAEAYVGRGFASRAQGDAKSAAEDYEQALRLMPAHPRGEAMRSFLAKHPGR